MGLFNDLTCEAGSLSCCCPNPHGRFQSEVRGFIPPPPLPRAGALGYMVCFTPRRSSWFICAGVWGCGVLPAALPAPFSATLSLALWVYLCTNVGPQGLLVVRLPAPLVPHSASLGPAMTTRVLSAPVTISTPPTGLDVCFFFIYLVLDFLAVRFSVSSGCASRCSVSTYTAILVLC